MIADVIKIKQNLTHNHIFENQILKVDLLKYWHFGYLYQIHEQILAKFAI